jgi:hypothetical protein
MTVPAKIDIAQAQLPATYEQAKTALASCASIDECQDWANKAEALASYAKMADDDSLRQLADRIQARAVRRMGELYKSFNAQGQRTDKLIDGAVNKLSQKEVRESAGISERQAATAVRVANVPAEKFEAAIEQPKPATVTALAEMGKQVRSAPIEVKPAEVSSLNGLRVALAGLDPILDRVAQIGVDVFWREADERVRKQIEGTGEFLRLLTATGAVQHQSAAQTDQPEAAS